MTERTFNVGGLEVRHLPDYSYEPNASGGKDKTELPGFIEIGVPVDGHFVVLAREKAQPIFEGIERAKQTTQDTPGPQEV